MSGVWTTTEDEYGIYQTRVNENGLEEQIITRKQKWYDENPPLPEQPKPIPIEDLLAEKDRQIFELKESQFSMNRALEENTLAQQELLELLIDMGVL